MLTIRVAMAKALLCLAATMISMPAGADTPTPGPSDCCQCPSPACGPPVGGLCGSGCNPVFNAACKGATGQCSTFTPTPAGPTPAPTATCVARTTPLPCMGTTKLYLTWFAKDPSTMRVFVSGTHCVAPPNCAAAIPDQLVSVPPVTVTITDAVNQTLTKTVTDPGLNTGGCPGSDSYRGVDRVKLIYGAATTIVAKVRVPQVQSTPLTFTPPIRVTVRDGCGSLMQATVSTCFTKTTLTSSSVKCF